ncbi:MAG TPA: FAD-binding domain-containing protein [Sediminibacterium sp.]|uniref:FAD-binding domain-containing protein n=1 Tax=Sediminibacterium sp. TaxID=1917865 RepID=UPI0008C52030|nr:FAD-binding domain-containing protein [Sediminibacterium sp.]OHC85783.1 MAG: deoxyribodipyrimidine photolyase [Sphingobacteriia bacterium RIFOXYC2_FULL_35_18]OHC87319.1 MAG: deoxyribodipyrimidine photolyase [Sphingobacteriia bacterium RIFOXYD2_FULL_35_12]HLD52567.1 FAD-binding domain-containing protein [Sediminibacterium sp.]
MNEVLHFPTDYHSIIERIEQIDAKQYERTRNFVNGAVTYLSPYISRGVIQLPQIKEIIVAKYGRYISEKLVQELAWREFFQRVWQHKQSQIFTDLKQNQTNIAHYLMPTAIEEAQTGIEAVDEAIQTLYATGYMHNHARMYTAMLTCNIAQTHWLNPAKWMYYHLLDGDLASNMLSWQWVAGSFSSKKYYANQENINKYTSKKQQKTLVDYSYEELPNLEIPFLLKATKELKLETALPATKTPLVDHSLPILVYNSYNLDPNWHNKKMANRILLLEPAHFNNYPISKKVLDFILALAKDNIPDIQVYTGSFDSLKNLAPNDNFIYKEHPLNTHYTGKMEPRAWLFDHVNQYHGSFFSYWKKCERYYQ